jgi:lysozyme
LTSTKGTILTPTGIRGIDLSHNNTVTSFHQAQADGVGFVYLKCTQGVTFRDPAYLGFKGRIETMGNPSLPYGPYHFFDSSDPKTQAMCFLNQSGLYDQENGDYGTADGGPDMLIPMLDVETYFEGVAEAALVCATEIKALCGHFPILYCSDDWYQQYMKAIWPPKATLWIAKYSTDQPMTENSIWQYSESGAVPGVQGECDLDIYRGTITQLESLLIV